MLTITGIYRAYVKVDMPTLCREGADRWAEISWQRTSDGPTSVHEVECEDLIGRNNGNEVMFGFDGEIYYPLIPQTIFLAAALLLARLRLHNDLVRRVEDLDNPC